MLTLIGTSTNLLVDGVARANGLEPFGIFEMTPVAIVILIVGFVFIGIAAPRVLPERNAMVDFLGSRKDLKFMTEVVIPEGSDLIGEEVLEIEVFDDPDIRVIDVVRDHRSQRRNLKTLTLQSGDRVVLRSSMAEVLSFSEDDSLTVRRKLDRLGQRRTITVETLISPGSLIVGKRLGDLHLRRGYGVYVLGVHRRSGRIASHLDDVRLQVGDTVLFEGEAADIHRLADEQKLAELTKPSVRPYRRKRAPVVLAVLILVVVGSALGIMEIFGLALIGVAVVLVTRSIDVDEAFEAIDGRLLALIFAMLAFGSALQSTGAVQLIAQEFSPVLAGLPHGVILFAIFLLASCLTEMVSNSAVAVVMTPIAITLALDLDFDPRPFVVIVMFAASASFATPIGYQTNTLVYAPGGYRFTDYMRLGIPLNLGVGVLASIMVPLFWPL